MYNRRTKTWEPIPSVLEAAGEFTELPVDAKPASTTPPGSPPPNVAGFSSERPRDIKPAKGKRSRSPQAAIPQRPRSEVEDSPQVAQEAVVEAPEVPEAGPSSAPARKVYPRKPKVQSGAAKGGGKKKADKLFQYTTAYAPGLTNIKNPAGDFLQKETNVEVIRQVSQARAKKEKEAAEADRATRAVAGEEVPPVNSLSYTLIIHPGSRNLRIGRASDFYPKEVPFCIARPASAPNRGTDPPIPGSRNRAKAREAEDRRENKRQKGANGAVHANGNGHEEDEESDEWIDPASPSQRSTSRADGQVEQNIEDLRDYLRNRLRANRLATDHRDGLRVKQYNAKVKPEPIPEHNDPYRIEWTEVNGKKFFVGTEALRLPSGSGFKVRYPLLHRGLNTRDWGSPQLLMDDIATILHESIRTELDIHPRDYSKYSVVLLVPDHADRLHLQALACLLFGEFGFKELAIHQESHAAIFSAGMSTACVVDIGATSTSVACVDEGLLLSETRIKLDYGGDDITAALVTLLQRSNFPYQELNLARAVDWMMMEKLKEKICTLEEHMVANISWDVYVLKEQGLTQKYQLRTYDENILAPLCFFDTRMIDFKEKVGSGRRMKFWEEGANVDDMMVTGYGEATGAMRACSTHLLPPAPPPPVPELLPPQPPSDDPTPNTSAELPVPPPTDLLQPELNGSQTSSSEKRPNDTPAGSAAGTPAPADVPILPAPLPISAPVQSDIPLSAWDGIDVVGESARSPLDAAIAAAISLVGTENKVKAAAGNILLIGGGSALKGLYPFIEERLPPLLRAKGLMADVSIIPPPRGLNPRFVSWKGASVMCNLESLNDMWIRREEWEALGARSLKDRLLFL